MNAVIFDFNGTMVFDAIYHDQAWKLFSEKVRGTQMSDEEIANHVHGNVNEKIIEYLKADTTREERHRLSLEKEKMYRELASADVEHYQLVKGLPQFLDMLADQHIHMNIASASIKENIAFFVEVFKLDRWFDPTHIIYDNGTYLNKIDMFKDAAKKMSRDISECIIFEDSRSGIACAKAVHPKKIIVLSKNHKNEYVDDPQIDLVIEDFEDERLKQLFAE